MVFYLEGLNLKKNVVTILFIFTISCLLLTGCGKKSQELKTYKASMETFFSNISYLNDTINAIDPTSDTATEDLLNDLDTLNEQFSEMAALDVPSEFSSVEDLADQASENMANAVSYYHQAYEADTFQENYAEAANEYYERANVRIKYIIEILHGEDITETDLSFGSEEAITDTQSDTEEVTSETEAGSDSETETGTGTETETE